MTDSSRQRIGIIHVSPLWLLVPPLAVTSAFWLTSPNASEPAAFIYASLLLLMPWGSFLCWRQGTRQGLPVFAMIAGTYWLFFGLAMFSGSRELYLAGSFGTYVPPESVVTSTMSLTVIGVVALWIGMRVPLSVWVPANLPDIADKRQSWVYIRLVVMVGIV